MKQKEIEAIESYFETENDHWNKFAFEMLCEQSQQGRFESPETPLQLFSNSVEVLLQHYEHPFKAVKLFTGQLDKQNPNPAQRLFIFDWLCKYLEQSEFDFDMKPIEDLLKSHRDKLKAESQQEKSLTKNIRQTLKETMQKEIERLPEVLETLEPKERLNILCKLMPFVFPKVESVSHAQGEPDEHKINW